ncbi:hypothetical protein M6B38_191460 [Iris pallida]|uniref:Uncharacterized protein n=1 Tax=Iris pallida TaxID=29817 RepID=A0AAX6EFR7_IRIPA|nr:hypothetical protein M6B38_191460 [Iris pallida]
MTRSALAERRFKRQVQRLERAVDPKSWHRPDEESMQGLHWSVKMNPDLDFQKRARSIARSMRTSLRWVAPMNPSLLSLYT